MIVSGDLICLIILNKLDTLNTRTVLGNSLLTTRNSGLTNLTPVARLLPFFKSGCSNKTYSRQSNVCIEDYERIFYQEVQAKTEQSFSF